MDKRQKRIITITLLVTVFISLLNQTLLITALPAMAHDLNVRVPTAQWLTSGYVLMVGISTPISATLTEKFTSRQLYLGVIGNFILGTLIAVFANSFAFLLLARLIQAVSSGILMTFVIISLVNMNPPEKRGAVMGMVSLVMSSAPAIGPSLAGLILHFFSWHYLFYLILPIMVLAWILGYFFLPNFTEANPDIPIDYVSILTSSIGLGAILASITMMRSSILLACAMLIIGIVLMIIFVKRQLSAKQPMLNLYLFRNNNFTRMVVIAMLIFGILLGTEAVLPVFFEAVNGYSSLVSGLILLPGAFASGITATLVGKYYDKNGPAKPLFVGIAIILLSSLFFLMVDQKTGLAFVVMVYTVRLIGVGMIMSTANAQALHGLKGVEISHGTALNNSLRQVNGSFISTMMMILLTAKDNMVSGLHLAIGLTIGLLAIIFLMSKPSLKK